MKIKYFLIFALCLISIGCRDNYLAEKAFWKAGKIMQKISPVDIEQKGIKALEPAIEAYEQVFFQYPSTPKAAESLFIIAGIYEQINDPIKARESLERVIQNFSHTHGHAVEARYQIAQLFERGGHWDKAEKAFWEITDYHPLHERGLFAPIHIIVHYKTAKNEAAQAVAYEKSLEFYDRVIRELGDIKGSSRILNFQALAHLAHGDWRKAGKTWLGIAKEFPDTEQAPISLIAAGELFWKHENYADSEDVFEDYFTKYPQHPFRARTAERMAMLHEQLKQYDEAYEWYDRAIEYSKPDKNAVAKVKALLARSHMMQKNWKETDEILDEIEKKYKKTDVALQVPLLRSMRLEASGDLDSAKKVINSAIAQYKRIETSARDPKRIVFAQKLLNAALIRKGDWGSVLTNFDEYMQKSPSEKRKGEWKFMKAYITERQIADGSGALEMYTSFIDEHPDHPLVEQAENRKNALLAAA